MHSKPDEILDDVPEEGQDFEENESQEYPEPLKNKVSPGRDIINTYLKEMGRVPMFSRKGQEEKIAGRKLISSRLKLLNALLKFKPSINKGFLEAKEISKNENFETYHKNRDRRQTRLLKIGAIWKFLEQFKNEYARWPTVGEVKEYFKEVSDAQIKILSNLWLEGLKEEAQLRLYLSEKPNLNKKNSLELLRKKFKDLNCQIFSRIVSELSQEKVWRYWQARIFEEIQIVPALPASLRKPLFELMEIEKEFVQANLRLVVPIAQKYFRICYGSKLEFGDLIQTGNLGLYEAARRFDPQKGFKFSTFATWWVRNLIQFELDVNSNTIRLPSGVIERYKKIQKLSAKMAHELGREPTAEEIVARFQDPGFVLTVENLRNIFDAAKGVDSLDRKISSKDDEADLLLGDSIEDRKLRSPEEQMLEISLEDFMDSLFSQIFSPQKIEIINLRFGRKGNKIHTLEEIGVRFNLSRERIRQIEEEVLERLRHPSRKEILRKFLEAM